MIRWFKITFPTKGWDENKEVICHVIKPVVETLEKTEDIISFFFLEYYDGKKDTNVKFWFYGNEDKVMKELNKYRTTESNQIEKFDPASQSYRFGEDYFLGIKMFELGSRLALCRVDNKSPIDNTGPGPIILTLLHAFLQNLGYSSSEEGIMSGDFAPPLLRFYSLFTQTNIK